jgi:hypothetical protein
MGIATCLALANVLAQNHKHKMKTAACPMITLTKSCASLITVYYFKQHSLAYMHELSICK